MTVPITSNSPPEAMGGIPRLIGSSQVPTFKAIWMAETANRTGNGHRSGSLAFEG